MRLEGESRVKGDTKELDRGQRRDDLTVISEVLWVEPVALSPFKEHHNRFGAALHDAMIGVNKVRASIEV